MRRCAFTILAAVCILVAIAVTATAELTQEGNLRLQFNGRIDPKRLPRKAAAPISMQVSGAVHTADGNRPPELRKISISFNRFGRVTTLGLPTCDAAELESATSKGALRICRQALVGHGNFHALVNFSGTHPVAVIGQALAFNSTHDGKPAFLLHVYVSKPVQATVVVPFTIRRLPGDGTFGTVFTAKIPKIAAHSGYVTSISLTFDRRYGYRGHRHSFLSARCAVPAGIPGAVFTLARGTFTFSNGQRLSQALARNCWVR